jgi:hypothetical protein
MSGMDPLGRPESAGLTAAVEGRAGVRRSVEDLVPWGAIAAMSRRATRAADAGKDRMWRFVAVEDTGRRPVATRLPARRQVADVLDVR